MQARPGGDHRASDPTPSSRRTVSRLALVVFGLAVARPAAAQQYPPAQLVTSAPAPLSVVRPAYLVPTVLPGLGTSVIRVSDQATFGGGRRYYRHYYAKQEPWNADGTRLVLSHDSSTVYFLDGRTLGYLRTATNVPEYPKWSSSNPDLMFGVTGVTFVTYAPSTGVSQPLRTFTGFTQMYLGIGEGNLSDDDRYAPLVGVYAGGLTVVIYDTVNNVEVSRKDFPGASTATMDWASMSPSGQYVVVNVDASPGLRVYDVYDRQMTFLRRLPVYAGGHADLGYDSAGHEVIVSANFVGGQGVLMLATRLDNGAVQQQLPGATEPAGIYMTSNYHISCRNLARPGYCYVSGVAFSAALNAYMYREVFSLKLDGSGTVERFSQDFKAELPLADLDYTRGAQAVPNRDGSLVLFASDWGDPGANAIIYDYVAGVLAADAGAGDAGTGDAGAGDAGAGDAGAGDAGVSDAGAGDAGAGDAGVSDAGAGDAGAGDAGAGDAGADDAGADDAGVSDAGADDAGADDAGADDGGTDDGGTEDGGTEDAGTEDGGGAVTGKCGCQAVDGPVALAFGLALWVASRRARRVGAGRTVSAATASL